MTATTTTERLVGHFCAATGRPRRGSPGGKT